MNPALDNIFRYRWTMSLVPELEPLDFDCPRCHIAVHERFYGPCADCREILQADQKMNARVVDVAPYEPKMNVTPNFVATKE